MQSLKRCAALLAFCCPVEQLSISNDRKHRFSGAQLAESPQDFLRSFLADVNTNICVQQIAGLHQSPRRFCGRSLSRPVSSRSSGSLASRSNARTMVPSFSRKTISSPRRKISTSLLDNHSRSRPCGVKCRRLGVPGEEIGTGFRNHSRVGRRRRSNRTVVGQSLSPTHIHQSRRHISILISSMVLSDRRLGTFPRLVVPRLHCVSSVPS